ncbi:MAG: flagellar hook-associated protein FlgK [Pseudomonadota bacterium]
MISRGSLILGIARDALTTHRLASDVAAHNIANVSTPGYARSRAELEALTLAGGRGQGVIVATLQHARTRPRDDAVQQATSQQGGAALARDLAELGELALATPGTATISDRIASFFGALRQAEGAPQDLAARRQVLASAAAMTQCFNRAATAVASAQASADSLLTDGVQQANQALATIASLNAEIHALEGSGTPALDQRNARALAVEELATQVAVEVHEDSDGTLRVSLQGGPVLVEGGRSHALSASKDPVTGRVQVAVATSTARHQLDSDCGGRLGAALEQRDGELAALASGLDQLAFDLAGALNAVHSAGTGLDGVSARDLLDAGAGVNGAAAHLSLAAAVVSSPEALAFSLDAAGLPGDNRNLQLLLGVSTVALPSGRTASQSAGDLLAQAGVNMRSASAAFDEASARLGQTTALRESVQGVSLEEEMIAQAQAQRAFEAASKLVTVADEMFSTVLDMVRR